MSRSGNVLIKSNDLSSGIVLMDIGRDFSSDFVVICTAFYTVSLLLLRRKKLFLKFKKKIASNNSDVVISARVETFGPQLLQLRIPSLSITHCLSLKRRERHFSEIKNPQKVPPAAQTYLIKRLCLVCFQIQKTLLIPAGL